MASQALYRKWRSQTFGELIGQEHVVRTLQNAIVEERVAHAYLFTGPRGVGKTSMARLLAKAVNCTASEQQRPCGTCESCRSIAEGRAVDVIEMDAASHTSVDDAREIIERVQFRPTLGLYKVYVIDEVHMLSTAAFNALLKTLEEPPAHAIFILATTEVHKVPATILSRCQRFTFTRLGIADIAGHLQRIAAEEHLQLVPGVAEMIARAATGSMRDALGVLEQLGSFAGDMITQEQVQSLLGMTAAAEVHALIEALLMNDLPAALHAVNGIADQGADLRQFVRDLVERLRALMLLVATGDQALVDLGDDERALLAQWAAQADVTALLQWVKIFSNLDYQLRTSPYGHLPLELAVVEALVMPAATGEQPVAAMARPTASARRTPSAPSPARPVPPPAARSAPGHGESAAVQPADNTVTPDTGAPSVPDAGNAQPYDQAHDTQAGAASVPIDDLLPPLPDTPAPAGGPDHAAHAEREHAVEVQAANADISILARVEEVWSHVVRDVKPHDPALQALLKDVRPDHVEDDTIILLAAYPFHKKQIEEPRRQRIVEDVLFKHIGVRLRIRCITEARSDAEDERSRIREAYRDPLVKAARNIFGADIVDIEQPE